uniref:Chitin-binding type-2 domain-containing protein n=1 Tax=Timema douglasi TaxID=61478 RepID=A0A7R8VMD3_TIMDO|nr:unnamed protein product [Timema douglasi]
MDHCSCQRRGRLVAGVSQSSGFDCPEEFGYYSHPSDCTQYYVCVFGGALLESCTGGLMYSHELQTCDWPRNVGCGSEGASATVSTVRVTDPRTRHTTPTGQSPSRSTSGALRIQNEQQKRQQQEEIAKHQLYADDLGPAEEIESDRQQRVYRGQPSILGQVARDRDGLRHKPVSNTLSSGSGQGANREKNEVISFGNQQQSINTQYSYDKLTQDENRLTNETIPLPARKKRQVRFSYPPWAESSPFQTHCFPDSLEAPEIKLGTSGSVARTYDH